MKEVIGIHVNDLDTCVTVAEEIHPGDTVVYALNGGSKCSVVSLSDIPAYHKIAITHHNEGEPVIKYGCAIGIATKEICVGEHVHIHNIRSAGLKATKDGALGMSSAQLSG